MKRKIFQLKQWGLAPKRAANYRALTARELWSADELAAYNWRRRAALVDFLFEKNPFYQEKLRQAGFARGDLKAPEDFQKLPILEKQEIREAGERMISRGFSAAQLKTSSTGGSTGVPLKTWYHKDAPVAELSWRMLHWWNVDISDHAAYLYRAVPPEHAQRLQQVTLWPTRRSWIRALDMDDAGMEAFYRRLRAQKTVYLVGYVGALDVFAAFIEQRNYSLPALKAVWTTAAPLAAGKRTFMQQVFQTPVYTQYGSCEFYWIAAECSRQQGMHIGTDVRHVDVVNGTAPAACGQYGDLLVTDLTNYAFPLLRYRLGDRGRLLPNRCACGRPFPLMDYVDGRISDKIHLPGGGYVAGEAMGGIFRGYPDAIKTFQVRQAKDYSITVTYEPLPGAEMKPVLAAVEDRLKAVLHGQVALRFVEGAIEVNDNGKTRFMISELET